VGEERLMAEIKPFKGVLYNTKQINDLAEVIAPPYDVISSSYQDDLYQRHPNNVIRLILGKSEPEDKNANDLHQRSANYFQKWLADDILIHDGAEAFYLTNVEFSVEDKRVIRYGIIGLVRLEPFEKGVVLPHERTFSKVKSERLNLMKHSRANFCSIFGLYSDTEGILDRMKDTVGSRAADIDITDDQGARHKLWRLTDEQSLKDIPAAMSKRTIYIADGHHRYETALNYRQWLKEVDPEFNDHHPANYVMMSLSSLEDPGMVIFPAHRLLKDVPEEAMASLIPKLKDFFNVQKISMNQGIDMALLKADAALAANKHRNAVIVYIKNDSAIYVLVLKDGVMQERYGSELPEPLLDLDVTVLTRLIMMDLLGFDQARLDDSTKISYRTTSQDATDAVIDGKADIAFILNPTRIEQVQRVAEHGLIMPRKSTYFYPKIISGQVMNTL
jgi:uncharacterized protein (DUF1015 family)